MASSFDSLMNNFVKDGRKLTGFKDYSEDQHNLPSLDVDIHLRMISTAQKVPDSPTDSI